MGKCRNFLILLAFIAVKLNSSSGDISLLQHKLKTKDFTPKELSNLLRNEAQILFIDLKQFNDRILTNNQNLKNWEFYLSQVEDLIKRNTKFKCFANDIGRECELPELKVQLPTIIALSKSIIESIKKLSSSFKDQTLYLGDNYQNIINFLANDLGAYSYALNMIKVNKDDIEIKQLLKQIGEIFKEIINKIKADFKYSKIEIINDINNAYKYVFKSINLTKKIDSNRKIIWENVIQKIGFFVHSAELTDFSLIFDKDIKSWVSTELIDQINDLASKRNFIQNISIAQRYEIFDQVINPLINNNRKTISKLRWAIAVLKDAREVKEVLLYLTFIVEEIVKKIKNDWLKLLGDRPKSTKTKKDTSKTSIKVPEAKDLYKQYEEAREEIGE